MNSPIWKLNTSNLGKFADFKKLFAKHQIILEPTHIDLDEIEGDPIEVVVHKACQLDERVLVEDTSLDIEGADVGIQVRWVLDHLDKYAGKKATCTVLMAYHDKDSVFVYRGTVPGTIVLPAGKEGFGFDPIFLPLGATKTLAESKPDEFNARAKAVNNLLKNEIFGKYPLIKTWNGPWQKND